MVLCSISLCQQNIVYSHLFLTGIELIDNFFYLGILRFFVRKSTLRQMRKRERIIASFVSFAHLTNAFEVKHASLRLSMAQAPWNVAKCAKFKFSHVVCLQFQVQFENQTMTYSCNNNYCRIFCFLYVFYNSFKNFLCTYITKYCETFDEVPKITSN